jgi:transposase InsO family protein
MNIHKNARTTPQSRAEIVRRVVEQEQPGRLVAAAFGISERTVRKWVTRARQAAGLVDGASRPHRSPRQLPGELRELIERLRQQRWTGAEIAHALAVSPATVARYLRQRGLARLRSLAPPVPVVRYEYAQPGELVHLDIKKLGRLRDGGGWRAHGRAARRRSRYGPRVGYEYVHSAVDDHSRLAYSEILPDETGPSCAGFLERAIRFYRAHDVSVERVLTDNAITYRNGFDFHRVLDEHGIGHRLIRPYRPQTNGKVERYNRTLLDEWAYASAFDSGDERKAALTTWLNEYNYHRPHHALAGKPPASRVNNVPGRYS